MHLHVLSDTCLWISLCQGRWCYSLVNKAIICQTPMICLGCLMVEDQPQWLLDLHLGPPSPSNLAVLVSGSWSFSERDGVLFHSHCWLVFHICCCCGLTHAVFMWPSTCSVVGTFYIHCWYDLPCSLLMGLSIYFVDEVLPRAMLMGPSSCNVDETFKYSDDGVKRFVPCSCKLISDRTAMEQKKIKNSFEVEFCSIIYTLTSKSYKLQSAGIIAMNHHAWFNSLFSP